MNCLHRIVVCILVPMWLASCGGDFDSPESAVRALESAYIRKDIEAAVAAKDFHEEARLMLQTMNPSLATDKQVIEETAQVLELSFRSEIAANGFPNFDGLACSITNKETLSPSLVKLTEECISQDGRGSVQELAVAKSANGWHMVVMQD